MKKLIAVILCAFVSSGFTHAGAQSNVPEGYREVDETHDVTYYDCRTGEEKTVSETFKTYVPVGDEKGEEVNKDIEPYGEESPQIFPKKIKA